MAEAIDLGAAHTVAGLGSGGSAGSTAAGRLVVSLVLAGAPLHTVASDAKKVMVLSFVTFGANSHALVLPLKN